MYCPECHKNLVFQAFWQGRHVNCTSCGARLQRARLPMFLSFAGGVAAWLAAEWVAMRFGAPMEVEIPVTLIALAAGYLGVHAVTLKLEPREDDETRLKL